MLLEYGPDPNYLIINAIDFVMSTNFSVIYFGSEQQWTQNNKSTGSLVTKYAEVLNQFNEQPIKDVHGKNAIFQAVLQ